MQPNPFKPSAGSSPPELIGRESSLERIREGVTDGPGAPGRIMLFSGARGIGKTVMLNEVEEAYLAEGWLRVSLTATPGLLAQLQADVRRLLASQAPGAKRRITGVSAGGVGVDWENTESVDRPVDRPVDPSDLRSTVERLLDVLAPERGLLLTIDEVHGGERDQLREVAALSQHMVRDDRQFALAMAGLPSSVSNLLSDHVLTFLRRADRHDLRALAVDDGPSRVSDLATRLGQSRQYVNAYRGRLVAAGVIEAPARGRLDFAIPYLRDTLREPGAVS